MIKKKTTKRDIITKAVGGEDITKKAVKEGRWNSGERAWDK
jgi:hypothetical protein